MTRYFIDINKAHETYTAQITLLNKNLIIKSTDKAGNIVLNPILSTGGLHKNQVAEFVVGLKNKNEELLYEVYEKEINERKILLEDVHVYKQNKQGLYYDATKPVFQEIIKLIEIGALAHSSLKNLPVNDYEIITLSPDVSGDGTYFYNKNSLIQSKISIKRLNDELISEQLGSGVYLLTNDPEILDECRSWITEITAIGNDNCYINSKNHYLVKPLEVRELNNLTKEEVKLYKDLITSAIPVKKQRVNNHIITVDTDANDYDDYFLVQREALEPLLKDGFDQMQLKEYIEVYTQNINQFSVNTLEDTLDSPKSYFDKKRLNKKEVINNAYKIDVFYEQNPLLPIDKILLGGEIVEFEQVGTQDNLPIWKQTYKIIQNKSKQQFAEDLANKGNKYFIKVSDSSHANEIYRLYGNTKLLHEFVRYENDDYPSKNNINYYVSRPYEKNSNKVMTK